MKKLLLTLLLLPVIAFGHGSSHNHLMREYVDIKGNPYMICNQRIISIHPIIQLHVK